MKLSKLVLTAQKTAEELGVIHPSMPMSVLNRLSEPALQKLLDTYLDGFFALQERNIIAAINDPNFDSERSKLIHVRLKHFHREHKRWAKSKSNSS